MFAVNGYQVCRDALFTSTNSFVYSGVKKFTESEVSQLERDTGASKNGKDYILKFYHRFHERKDNDIRIHKKLKGSKDYSKYVVELVESFVYKEFTVLVFEKGEIDLLNYIKYNSISFEEQVKICIKVVECVQFIHSQGVVHADIKLENVVMVNGEAKLIDFEYAFYSKNTSKSRNQLVGTKYYLDPDLSEQMLIYGKAIYNTVTDTYSVATLIYELTTKRSFRLPYKYGRKSSLIGNRYVLNSNILKILDKVLIFDVDKRIDLSTIKDELSTILYAVTIVTKSLLKENKNFSVEEIDEFLNLLEKKYIEKQDFNVRASSL